MKPVFGQIDYDLIIHFGDLSKNEIRVISILHARAYGRNFSETDRAKIIKETGLDKGNLSKAIAGLEEKNWCEETKDGFKLFTWDEISEINKKVVEVTTEKVVEPTTVVEVTTDEKLLNQQQKVVEVTTEVVEVTTCPPQTPHKEYLNTGNSSEREREAHARSPDEIPQERFVSRFEDLPDIPETENDFVPRQDSGADNKALVYLENRMKINCGNEFSNEVIETVNDFDIWKRLIDEKIAYADKAKSKRESIQTWILTEYNLRIEKKTGAMTKNGNNNSKQSDQSTAGAIIANRRYRRNRNSS